MGAYLTQAEATLLHLLGLTLQRQQRGRTEDGVSRIRSASYPACVKITRIFLLPLSGAPEHALP